MWAENEWMIQVSIGVSGWLPHSDQEPSYALMS